MSNVVEIAGMSVEPGMRAFGSLTIANRPGTDLELPITVINGAQDGPTMSITAAVHGAEYAGVVTCMRLGQEIDPQTLSGTLILIPVVNLPAFETRTPFVNPIDGQNVNRVFPGNRYGTVSEQITYTIYNDIIKRSDVYMDLHSGDLIELVPPHTCCQRVGNEPVDQLSETLARLFDIKLLNIMGKGIDDLSASEDEQGTYFAGLQSGLTSVGNAALAVYLRCSSRRAVAARWIRKSWTWRSKALRTACATWACSKAKSTTILTMKSASVCTS